MSVPIPIYSLDIEKKKLILTLTKKYRMSIWHNNTIIHGIDFEVTDKTKACPKALLMVVISCCKIVSK